MKQELSDIELNEVVGGTVNLSEKANKIGFTTLGEGYVLKCTFKQAKGLLSSLYASNDLSEGEFDRLVKREFKSRGWI